MDIQTLKQRYGIVGNSPKLLNALDIAIRVAPTDLSTLILGESGVGKEVFSQIIHALSPRKHNAFIAVNCGAIPEGTIDSELFGHEKGSFTGAAEARKGYFEVVNGGTIFLDEIGEMPLSTQSRLLRMLESGEYIRVGASKVQKADVRVIAATNVNLLEAVKNNKFREDLYYRLNTVPIYIPPLRERRDDILLLFRKFTLDIAQKYKSEAVVLDENAKDLLLNYSFPGNIRELKNIAEQLSILSNQKVITAEELLKFIPSASTYNMRMPSLSTDNKQQHDAHFSEREILYKMLFEMRQDMKELKQMIAQILQNPNNLDFSNLNYDRSQNINERMPIVIKNNNLQSDSFSPNKIEILEESLSIADKEKELIEKALKKHKGRRKEASLDLGMSERTLYRKIKELGVKE